MSLRPFGGIVLCAVSLGLLVGCQMPQPGLGNRLVAHAAMTDFAGLRPTIEMAQLNVKAGVPKGWIASPTHSAALFDHKQWRSPTRSTAVGVAWIHLPLPISARAMIFIAKTKYGGASEGAELTSQWTDGLGREWFEIRNEKFQARGYVVTSGFDGWVVYTGFRRQGMVSPVELGLAARAMDTIVPIPLAK